MKILKSIIKIFQCIGCGREFYFTEHRDTCGGCGAKLEEVTGMGVYP